MLDAKGTPLFIRVSNFPAKSLHPAESEEKIYLGIPFYLWERQGRPMRSQAVKEPAAPTLGNEWEPLLYK